MVILHLVTQRNQPYGSMRLACERCGRWVVGRTRPGHMWTDDPSVYASPPDGYVHCDRLLNDMSPPAPGDKRRNPRQP